LRKYVKLGQQGKQLMIICKICNQEFSNMISWKHLAKHNISVAEYKKNYGDTSTDEYLDKLRKFGQDNPNFGKKHSWSETQKANIKGREPSNKGKKVTNSEHLENLHRGIAEREKKYSEGILTRAKHQKTQQQKKINSERQIEYARLNPEKMKERAKKALQTKLDRGIDLGKSMRGKNHSEQTKQQARERMLNTVQRKTLESQEKLSLVLQDLQLSLLNDASETSLRLVCNICACEFSFTKQYFRPSKFKHSICPGCYPREKRTSNKEQALFDFVKTTNPGAIQNYRDSYQSKEIDIFIPSLMIGVEFNGLYWHSESVLLHNNKSEKSDFEKQKYFRERNIRLIQIFEDEWDLKSDIVKSRLNNILGKTSNVLYARKCTVKEISSSDAADFCNQNHIMGQGRSNARLGLFYQDQLVSVMTFSKSNLSRKVVGWEINRFASLLNLNIPGGASKLFSAFQKMFDPDQVISYADNRWSTGNLYASLGFKKASDGSPNYWYIKSNYPERIHRFSLRKNIADDNSLTEFANRKNQGYDRIWDCGSSKWIWIK